jgi:hypothetical protein
LAAWKHSSHLRERPSPCPEAEREALPEKHASPVNPHREPLHLPWPVCSALRCTARHDSVSRGTARHGLPFLFPRPSSRPGPWGPAPHSLFQGPPAVAGTGGTRDALPFSTILGYGGHYRDSRCLPFPRSRATAGSVAVFGEAGVGIWGRTWNRAVIFRGRGGRVLPQCVSGLVSPPAVYSCSSAVVFPTSLSCLVEGVRSGTRRRRGASASAQAGGEIGPGTRRTAPARAGTVRALCAARAGAALYGQCVGCVEA